MSEPLYDPEWVESGSATSRMMALNIGHAVRRDVIESDFDQTDSPWALEMQHALLYPTRTFTKGWASMAEVSAHPVAWEILARWCRGRVTKARYNEPQATKQQNRRYAYLARKVDHELDRLCAHPAYHDKAVKGVDPVVLPLYQLGAGAMAPTPSRAMRSAKGEGPMRVGLLLPHRVQATAGTLTRWEPHFTA